MTDEQSLLDLVGRKREAILAGVNRAGYPHLTNVLYVWDAEPRVARVSTTADRVKGRVLRRDPRAALHVPGDTFWAYAVAECDADLTAPAATPGDEACRELLRVHSAFYGAFEDEQAFFAEMIEARRLVVRLHVRHVYGLIHDPPAGG
jgi:PPOX class probable F420-dependent enzyme